MKEKILLDFIKKNKKCKNLTLAKSNSSSKKYRKNNLNNSESNIKQKKNTKNLHQRNILFNNKTSIINANSTSTSSLSSPTEKKYLTPTKFNQELNIGNYYYFNEGFNEKKNLFQNMNISMPKLNYNCKYKKIKNLHLALGAGINRYNNIYFSGNDYGNNKELIVNRSFKIHKNKLVLCRKVNISQNNSRNNDDEKDLSSKSLEIYNINKKLNDKIENNRYNNLKEKNKEKDNDYNNPGREKKYKNIVLRPHKIQKENQLSNIVNFKEMAIKRNIKVNMHKKVYSPEIINNINMKPKHSRVFKYK